MYTRCPECHTAFRITIAQLKARDGLVRCGRCDSVFRADLRLFAPAPNGGVPDDEALSSAAFIDLEALEESSGVLREQSSESTEIPVISDLSFLQPRRRLVPTVLWSFAAVVLTILLLGQFAYFFRHELAQLPQLRPALVYGCARIGCRVALIDKTVPELTRTSIAPHPRYANALRIRANIVNRTDQPLALPLLQVSLTDNNGKLLARRTFAPKEYLDPASAAAPLGPNVAVQAMLDVTNPDNKAAGYEVQLFRQPTHIN